MHSCKITCPKNTERNRWFLVTRVADPDGVDPDPTITKKKQGLYPTLGSQSGSESDRK